MRAEDIVAFLQSSIEPLPAQPPYSHSPRYRVSATLTDGTHLPCVVVEGLSPRVDLAVRRFDESRSSDDPFMGYRALVGLFAAKGNHVNDYDLGELGPSPYAIPLTRLREIKGETSMSWTEFYATMRDGKEFRFGTHFLTEFFDMPAGYAAMDIVEITPAVRGEKPRHETIYREGPFFTCYIDGLGV